jgi:NitT/TauT family transport system ATP-binding protein
VIVLSSSPTRVAEELDIDLPGDRDQLTTRADPQFTELRGRVYARIQKVKTAG